MMVMILIVSLSSLRTMIMISVSSMLLLTIVAMIMGFKVWGYCRDQGEGRV